MVTLLGTTPPHTSLYFLQIPSLSLTTVIQLLVGGIIEGLFYALMGLGFGVILEGMDLYDFAHGAFYMIGGYITYYSINAVTANPIIAVILSMAITFLFGCVVDFLTLRPVRKRGREDWVLAGLIILMSLSVLLENLAIIVFGTEYKGVPPYVQGHVTVGDIIIDLQRALSASLSAILILITYIFLKKTKYGRAIRALAQNKELAEISGVNPEILYPIIFGLGACLAAAAGSLLAPVYFISPTIVAFPGLMAFIVVIISGLGSTGGLILGGILLGITSSFVGFLYSNEWAYLVAFAIAIVVITFRPRGLFGVRRE